MFIKSYKSAFILLFVVQLLVTVSAIVYNAYWRTSDAILDLSRQIIEEASEKIIDRTDFIFRTAAKYLHINKFLVTQRDIIQNQGELLALFWQQLRLTPEIGSIYAADVRGNFVQARKLPRFATRMIDRRGETSVEHIVYRDQNYRPIAHIKGDAFYDPRKRPSHRVTGTESRVYLTDIYRFASTDKPGVTGTIPIVDDKAEIETIVGVDITLESLSEFLAEQRIVGAGFAMIVDEQGRLIAYPYQLKLRASKSGSSPEGMSRIHRSMRVMEENMESMPFIILNVDRIHADMGYLSNDIGIMATTMDHMDDNMGRMTTNMADMRHSFSVMDVTVYGMGRSVNRMSSPMQMFNWIMPF